MNNDLLNFSFSPFIEIGNSDEKGAVPKTQENKKEERRLQHPKEIAQAAFKEITLLYKWFRFSSAV